jgi:hypothetical protein
MKECQFDAGVVTINYAEGPPSGPPFVLLHGGSSRWRRDDGRRGGAGDLSVAASETRAATEYGPLHLRPGQEPALRAAAEFLGSV